MQEVAGGGLLASGAEGGVELAGMLPGSEGLDVREDVDGLMAELHTMVQVLDLELEPEGPGSGRARRRPPGPGSPSPSPETCC